MIFSVETELEFLLRIVLSIICGAGIGFERETRLKTAGIRTHIIVSLGSALMMIISKYGFGDVLQSSNIGLGPFSYCGRHCNGSRFYWCRRYLCPQPNYLRRNHCSRYLGNGWNRHGNRKRNVHYWYCYNGFIGDSSTVAAPATAGY